VVIILKGGIPKICGNYFERWNPQNLGETLLLLLLGIDGFYFVMVVEICQTIKLV
jgi:hypothetical protein